MNLLLRLLINRRLLLELLLELLLRNLLVHHRLLLLLLPLRNLHRSNSRLRTKRHTRLGVPAFLAVSMESDRVDDQRNNMKGTVSISIQTMAGG